MRSDNGSEFKNTAVKLMCAKEGIIQDFSAPMTPQQNGAVERANRTIVDIARTILSSSRLPLKLWGEAVLAAVYLRDRVPNKTTQGKTPFELFHGKPPSYDHLIEFDREIQVIDHGKTSSKFNSKTIDAYMVVYGSRPNTYRCYCPKTNTIHITSDVIVAPHKQHGAKPASHSVGITFMIENDRTDQFGDINDGHPTHDEKDEVSQGNHERAIDIDLPDISESDAREHCTLRDTVPSEADMPPPLPVRDLSQQRQINPVRLYSDLTSFEQTAGPPHAATIDNQAASTTTDTAGDQQSSTNAAQIVKRLSSALQRQKRQGVKSTYMQGLTAQVSIPEPITYHDAVNSYYSDEWTSAIQEELGAHEANETWSVVKNTNGLKEISARWVFKIKRNADGTIDKFKARLVARGFTQQAGVDYGEVFAPVVRMDSIRLLFSIAAQYGLKFKQFDIATAFLYGMIEEELYLNDWRR